MTPLIDGHQTMLAMSRAFLAARSSIVLAAWDIRADLLLVRGVDTVAREDGTESEHASFQALADAGLSPEAIAFWNTQELTVGNVLGFAVSRGAQVKLLLWDAPGMAHLTNNPSAQADALRAVGVDVLLDDSCRHITSAVRALHQKCAVIDGTLAFVGGVDLTSQETGDYDRWDTNHHPCTSEERVFDTKPGAHPWHDVHTRIEGPAVADVLANIAQRWDDVAARHGDVSPWPASLAATSIPPIRGGVLAQVSRTIPPGTYPSLPRGETTILEAYRAAIGQARHYIYLESQYFWRDVFLGLDNQLWGPQSPQMRAVIEDLAAALRRDVTITMLLPDHPNTGRAYTDGGLQTLRKLARGADRERLRVLTLGNSEDRDETISYRPVYVHAKVCIVDDVWWMAGSANLNSRGMHGDAEINVAAMDPATARHLRLSLWDEHAHPSSAEMAQLNDPAMGAALLWRRARENAGKIAAKQHLHGHLLPYLTHHEAAERGVDVSREHGWLDSLNPARAHHAEKYL
ncbi:MAG TPA: phospholipase D family protein [Ktedonobacterales bacterium]